MEIVKPLQTIRELTTDMMDMPAERREMLLIAEEQLLLGIEGRNERDHNNGSDVRMKLQWIRANCIKMADPCGTRDLQTRRKACQEVLNTVDELIAQFEEAG